MGEGRNGAAICPVHAPIPVIPYIFTRVSHRRARVIYANTGERRKTRENLSLPPLPPFLSSRIIDPRGMGNGLSLAIACLPAELIYAHQPVSMFARTISLRTEHGHGLCLLQPLPPLTIISEISQGTPRTCIKVYEFHKLGML